MFGVIKNDSIKSWKYLLNKHIHHIDPNDIFYDQIFLQDVVHPLIKNDCCIHSTFTAFKNEYVLPLKIPFTEDYSFVGGYVDENGIVKKTCSDTIRSITFKLIHPDDDAGFFSCCLFRLYHILNYIKDHKRKPPLVDTSDNFKLYTNKRVHKNVNSDILQRLDVTHDYFEYYLNNYDLDLPSTDVRHTWSDAHSPFSSLDYEEISKAMRIYMSPSKKINFIIDTLIEKYRICYEETVAVYYRATDKVIETQIATFDDFYNKTINVISKKNVKVLVQSDSFEFIEFIKGKNIDNLVIFDENKTSSTAKGVHHETHTDDNYEEMFYLLSTVIIISRCKYIVCGNSNVSLFMMYYRGNCENVTQFCNGKWYFHNSFAPYLNVEEKKRMDSQMSSNLYGYSFKKLNSGGLGAIIYEVLKATIYAKKIGYCFCFVLEGYDIPRLNGSVEDGSEQNDTWNTFFKYIPIIPASECTLQWPSTLPDIHFPTSHIDVYRDVLQNEIYILKPSFQEHIDSLVANSGFDRSRDIVIHIRKGDKENSPQAEVEYILSTDVYIDELNAIIEKNDLSSDFRIYICSIGAEKVREEIKNYYKKLNIDVIWDTNEEDVDLQNARYTNMLERRKATEETRQAFKNLQIMKDAKVLLGSRSSYFYRIAELLRRDTCVNLQDNQKFGKAEYFYDQESINPVRTLNKKAYTNFIKPPDNVDVYINDFKHNGFVLMKNMLFEELAHKVIEELNTYKWWVYAFKYRNLSTPKYVDPNADLTEDYKLCEKSNLDKAFAYRFRRHIDGHYKECDCVCCKLEHTMTNCSFIHLIEKITQTRGLRCTEVNIANYSKGDFINIHRDEGKGKFALTLSLTSNWSASYGGLLHFIGESDEIRTVVPSLGNIVIFKIDEKSDHFVSPVTVDRQRYMISAWYG